MEIWENIPAEGRLFIVAAPSGSGKSTLVRALMDRYPRFAFSISATTRPPRGKEKDGVHYYFLSVEEFIRLRDKEAFLEWEEVYPGRYYGTLKSEVARIFVDGQLPIFDVDVEGALHLKEIFGKRGISIFIQVPSLDILRHRLEKRGTDSPDEIAQRVEKARREMAYADRFDHIIINNDLDTAIRDIEAIVAPYL